MIEAERAPLEWGLTWKGLFILDTDFAEKIAKLTDTELESQEASAYNIAYGESYGRDYEAHADAIQEYEALAREWKRRRVALEQSRANGGSSSK